MRFVPCLFLLLLYSTAYGAVTCLTIFETSPEPNQGFATRVHFVAPRSESSQLHIAKLVRGINKVFNTLSIAEINIGVTTSLEASNARDNILSVVDEPEHGANFDAVFLHEFGHFIFNEHMRIVIDGRAQKWEEFNTRTNQELEEIKELRMRNGRGDLSVVDSSLVRTLTNPVDRNDPQFRSRLAGKLLEQRDFLEKRRARISSVRLAQSELFADLTASLMLDQPSVMADALGYPAVPPFLNKFEDPDLQIASARAANPNGSRPRDFSSVNHFKGWRTETANWGMTAWYTLMDPSRGAIWKMVETKMVPDVSKDQVLQAFLRAAEDQLSEVLLKPETPGKKDMAESLNQEFMKKFVQQAKTLGLWRRP